MAETVRCPSCDAVQADDLRLCQKCGASLREIVVGYKDRVELAGDRELLELEGWRMVRIGEGTVEAPLAVTYSRGPVQAEVVGGAVVDSRRGTIPAWQVLVVGVAFLAIAVAVGVMSGLVPRPGETRAAPPSATLTISGTAGVAFIGAIGASEGRQIRGNGPQTIQLGSGTSFSAFVQKQGPGPELLSVALVCADGTRRAAGTSAPYGTVSVSIRCAP